MDTEVCSFLSTQDPSFDANRQLEVLEMEGEVAEWRLELARREAHEVARRLGVSHTSSDYDLPAPVNVTGLLPRPFPRPRAKDSPTDRLSPVPMDTIEEESTEPEETAEDITLRTNSTNTTEEHTKVERRPKTMIRNIERRKAKLRTRAAAKAEADKAVGLTGDDGGDLMNINDE